MSWVAPQAHRVDPPTTGDERASVDGYLDYHRQTLLWKCSGLAPEQLKQHAVPTSNLTLLGLVRHMTEVERSWFRRRFAGEEIGFIHLPDFTSDADFDEVESADAEADFAAYLAELEACRAAVAGHGLDETFVHPRTSEQMSLRWVYLHMIEEYARHNGHADLVREAIDGETGE
jgi:uncharacterized damage-inducible protein DinB